MTSDPARPGRGRELARWGRSFAENVPHNRALGIEVLELGDGAARMRLPYAEHLVGNPDSGVLHGGAITALMDACCGSAVFMKLQQPVPIATLDLRIDYFKPAAPGRDVVASAECFRRARNVAFVRAMAYHDDPSDPIASATGAFMLATTPSRRGGAEASS